MDRLRTLEVFVAVAEARGFAPAARRLGLSPPVVTRAIAALEADLGVPLLRRTTRIVRLTDAGARYLEDCRRILALVAEADAGVGGSSAELRGGLSLTAPAMFGRLYLIPIVHRFLEDHPEVTARTVLVDRVVDLIDEGFDAAVRIAALPDSSLHAIRVGSVRRVVCASPAYLEANRAPSTPDDLAEHEAIGVVGSPPWTFRSLERERAAKPRIRLTVSPAEAAIAAAVAGRGLVRALSYQIVRELRAGTLVVLLAEHEPPPVPIHVVHDGSIRGPARAFVDFAVESLRAELSG